MPLASGEEPKIYIYGGVDRVEKRKARTAAAGDIFRGCLHKSHEKKKKKQLSL
jgi:hypothetical protein